MNAGAQLLEPWRVNPNCGANFFWSGCIPKSYRQRAIPTKIFTRFVAYGAAVCGQPVAAQALTSKTRRSGSLPGKWGNSAGWRQTNTRAASFLSRSTHPRRKPGGNNAPFHTTKVSGVGCPPRRSQGVRAGGLGGCRVIPRVPSSNLSSNSAPVIIPKTVGSTDGRGFFLKGP